MNVCVYVVCCASVSFVHVNMSLMHACVVCISLCAYVICRYVYVCIHCVWEEGICSKSMSDN